MKVIGIHGILHDYLAAPQIEHEWLLALQGGLELAGKPRIKSEDFTCIAYGDVFRPSGTRSAFVPLLKAEDITTDWEKELLLKWWEKAAALSAENRSGENELGEDNTIQDPQFQGRGRTPDFVKRALRQLSKSKYIKAWGPEKVLIFALKQVREYLHNQELKQKILQRVTDKVSEDTQVIIAHSLGSVVAYEALCANPQWNVHTLVTLGSPLGIQNLIFHALTPKPENELGVCPNVKQWFNIADKI